jgi:hypothetical protein
MFERLVGHHRPKIGAADADIENVFDAFAGVALPFAAADAIGKFRNLVEHGMNFRHHIFPVHKNGFTFWCAQRHVQHRAIFRRIDFLAAEHRVNPFPQARFLCQLQQHFKGRVGDPVFGIIQIKAGGLNGHTLAPLGISGE